MRKSARLLALLTGTALTSAAMAEESYNLDAISVTGATQAEGSLVTPDPQPNPKSTVNRAGLDLLGGPGQTSAYSPLALMPSTVVESPDPYGFSEIRNLNIRGKSDYGGLARNVNGLPIAAKVGGADLFDLENVEQIDLYRGGLQAFQAINLYNNSGAIDQLLLAPRDKFTAFGKQSFGSYDFHRTFVRADSGTIAGTGTRAFLSTSVAGAEKWKGNGDASSDRTNLMLGLSQPLGERVTLDANMVYNKISNHAYRGLSYSQAKDIRNYRSYDYNTALTGVAAQDANFYNFNRTTSETAATLADIKIRLADGHYLDIKPYYWTNNGVQYSTSGNNVQIWHQQNDNMGNVLEYTGHLASGTDVVLGYWLQSMEPPPPPTDTKLYAVDSRGGLSFSRWGTLAKVDPFFSSSPYVQVSQTLGGTYLTAGVRYLDLTGPAMQYYDPTGLPNVSYDQVWAYNPTPYADGKVAAKHYREFQPNFGIRQELTPEWSVNASYARKLGGLAPGPQASTYFGNRAAFLAKGITLQTLMDEMKLETSDHFDVGVRYNADGLTVVPTLFYARNRNRSVLISDAASGLSYYRYAADTTHYGAELEVAYRPNASWSFFGSGTLGTESYDRDTAGLAGGAMLATKGKQLPNTPQVMLKGGLTYQWNDLALSPVVRFIGQRYGDSVEAQPIGAYTVVDFNANYTLHREFGTDSLSVGLMVQNLLDRKYVSEIAASDFNLTQNTTYYAGAPRTIVGTVSVKF
jgi:iron complex outermembrane receptor protein